MPRQKIKFQSEAIYHLSNIGNTGEDIFLTEDNYEYFLDKFFQKSKGVFDILGYCLLPNQYHLIVKVKPVIVLKRTCAKRKYLNSRRLNFEKRNVPKFVSQIMANFLNGYAKAFNRREGRKGSLFRENFRKVLLEGDEVVKEAIAEIMQMPVFEGLVSDKKDYPYISENRGLKLGRKQDKFLDDHNHIKWKAEKVGREGVDNWKKLIKVLV